MLELFDKIGVVVKYTETTLLDPNWLTTAVYRILTHAHVVQQQGELELNDLRTLLADLPAGRYPRERWQFIVEMMERFRLCFSLRDHPEKYLIPDQLPVNEPKLEWDLRQSLRFRYDYTATPPRGLLPRFIVEAHAHLTTPRIAWLSGVVLMIQGCEVLAKIHRHNRQLLIAVRGSEGKRRDALAVVREYFARVHEVFQFATGTDVSAKIPVEVYGRVDAAFDFEYLETCERQGVKEIPHPGSNHMFVVKDLLAGVGPEPARSPESHSRGEKHFHFHNRVEKFEYHEVEGDMSETNIAGNVIGSAVGAGAKNQTGNIVANIQQGVQKSSLADDLKTVLAQVLDQLSKDKLPAEELEEAAGTVTKIQKELEKPAPNTKLLGKWVETVETVSAAAGKILRGASAIGSLFTGS